MVSISGLCVSGVYFPLFILFQLKDQQKPDLPIDELSIMHSIVSEGQDEFVEQLVINEIETKLRRDVVPAFWQHFTFDESRCTSSDAFKEAVDSLFNSLACFVPVLRALVFLRQTAQSERLLFGHSSLMESFKVMVRSSLHSQLPLNYQAITEDFYRISFKVFCNSESKDSDQNESTEDILQCAGCNQEIDLCQCQAIIKAFHETNG